MRSGTTLFSAMLDTHENISCGYETELLIGRKVFDEILYKFGFRYQVSERLSISDISKIEHRLLKYPHVTVNKIYEMLELAKYRRHVFSKYFFDEYLNYSKKGRWAEKTPGNTFFIESLLRYYPKAKFIHLIRDYRDFYLSYRQYMYERGRATNIVLTAYYWNRNLDVLKQRERYPNQVLIIKYEDLIEKTESTLKAVFDFLEEDFEAKCLNYYEYQHDTDDGNHVLKVKKPVDNKNIGRYLTQMTPMELAVSKFLCSKSLQVFGYELS